MATIQRLEVPAAVEHFDDADPIGLDPVGDDGRMLERHRARTGLQIVATTTAMGRVSDTVAPFDGSVQEALRELGAETGLMHPTVNLQEVCVASAR